MEQIYCEECKSYHSDAPDFHEREAQWIAANMPLKWTKGKPPVVVGWYWMYDGGDELQIVEIIRLPYAPFALQINYSGDDQTTIVTEEFGSWWCGPLSAPPLPKEVK